MVFAKINNCVLRFLLLFILYLHCKCARIYSIKNTDKPTVSHNATIYFTFIYGFFFKLKDINYRNVINGRVLNISLLKNNSCIVFSEFIYYFHTSYLKNPYILILDKTNVSQ